MTRPAATVTRIEALLTSQRTALLAGDLAALDGMAQSLGMAMQSLHGAQLPADGLARLRAAAARNAQLLSAARGGVAEARAHLASQSETALTTYDAAGRQRARGPGARTLVRR